MGRYVRTRPENIAARSISAANCARHVEAYDDESLLACPKSAQALPPNAESHRSRSLGAAWEVAVLNSRRLSNCVYQGDLFRSDRRYAAMDAFARGIKYQSPRSLRRIRHDTTRPQFKIVPCGSVTRGL